jgi:hypothetical protein
MAVYVESKSSKLNIENAIGIPAGTEASPSLYFQTNTDTGVYSSSGEFSITVNGDRKLAINENEITTTVGLVLNANLEMLGNAAAFPSADAAAFIGRTDATGAAPFDQAGSLVYRPRVSSTAGRSSHIFYTGSPSSERVRIDESGTLRSTPGGTFSTGFTASAGDGIYISSLNTTEGLGSFGAAISWSRLGNGTVRSAAVAPVQTGADSDLVGLAFFVHSSTSASADIQEAVRIDASGNLLVGTTTASSRLTVNGVITVSAGTAAAPALVASGDSNTGVFFPAADTFAISTAGSERVRVNASGNVGIGNNGGVKLDVQGPIAARSFITVAQTSAAIFEYNSNTAKIRAFGATPGTGIIDFQTGGGGGSIDAFAMRIDSSQNVGIGTTTPNNRLSVVGQFSAGNVERIPNNSGAAGFYDRVEIGGGTQATKSYGSLWIYNSSNSQTHQFHSFAGTDNYINNGGKLGVNTASPASTLHVNGVITVSAGTAAAPAIVASGDSDTGCFFPGANIFAVSTAGVERFRIDSTGRIGITQLSNFHNLYVNRSATGNTTQIGVGSECTILSDVTSQFVGFRTNPVTSGSFNLTNIHHYQAAQFSALGAGSSVTNIYGFNATDSLGGKATNTYGFYSDLASASNTWNLYVNGTAPSIFNGRVFFPGGSQAEPSISISSDTNTGLYAPSADNLAITTSGTERLRVNASGQVGIGRSSPQYLLDIGSNADSSIMRVNTIQLRNYLNITNGDNANQGTSAAGAMYSPLGIGYGTAPTTNKSITYATNYFSSPGDAQKISMVVQHETTNTTPAYLNAAKTGGYLYSTYVRNDTFLMPINSSATFTMHIVANNNTDGTSAGWIVKGCVKSVNRSLSLVGTPTIENFADAGMSSASINIETQDGSGISAFRMGGLLVEVTGISGKTIRWVCTIDAVITSF